MKWTLLLLAPLLAACNSGSSTNPALVAAGQCASLGLADLDQIFSEVNGFLASIGGTLPPNVTYDPNVSPDFSIAVSFGTIDGTVTSTDDISDGIDPGESASATWSINPGAGVLLTGAGTFNLTRTAAQAFAITGTTSVVDGTCTFSASGIDLALDLTSGLGPAGSFDFNATTLSGPLVGTMTFDGSDTAVVDAMFLVSSVMFTIDLNTFTPHF